MDRRGPTMDVRVTNDAAAPAWSQGADELVALAYERYAPEIQAHLRALVRDPGEAEDLTQETFLRLLGEVAEGRPPENTRAWLHRVAMNLAMSYGRHRQVAQRAEPRLRHDGHIPATEDLAVRHEEHLRVRGALDELRDRDRQVVLLAAAGVSGEELADRMGRSGTATRTLLCRARGRLRALLAEPESAFRPTA